MPTYWKNWTKTVIVALVATLMSIQVSAQTPTDNSPYSRYGLGNLESTTFGAVNGMGSIGTGYYSNAAINVGNPASLGFLRTTSFDVGLQSRFTWQAATDGSESYTADGNLSHMVLAFPLKNPINRLTALKYSPFNWGTAFGVMPYSKVAYNIETERIVTGVDTVASKVVGAGGLYEVFLSNGVSYKGIAFGVKMGYLFGNIQESRTAIFTDVPNSFSNIFTDKTYYKGFVYKLGVQKEFILNKDEAADDKKSLVRHQTRLILGATANNTMQLKTTATSIGGRYNASYGFDTISNSESVVANTVLPSSFGFGATLTKDNHWLVGVDFSATQWGSYQNATKSDSLANSFRIGFGTEYTPDYNAYNKYLKRVSYRFGGFYELDPRIVAGEQLTTYGLTLGMGLPISLPKKGTVGYTNLALEAGRLGVGSPIAQSYLRVSAAFSLNDNSWFYKRKFE